MKNSFLRSIRLRFAVVFVSLMVTFGGFAQNQNQVLLSIDGTDITVSEFMNVYKKNNIQTEVIDKKTLDEYLDLFINFKLKVRDAIANGLDTAKSFKDELAGYRKQLAAPYFVDDIVVESLIKEAYDRMQWDIRASHILIKCDQNAAPKDTMAAFKKISEIYEKIQAGADFGKMAAEFSDDPSAKDREANNQHPFLKGNNGDLGFFTVFNMVYPFETAAYKTDIGHVSKPTRSNFGYHLIKVTDKRPALGKVQAAHLFLQIPPKSTRQDSLKIAAKIDSLYQRVLEGENFGDLVKKFSDDKGSAQNRGALPWFTCNRLVPEFILTVYNLKDTGMVAKPVLTSYGWHIIKLLDRKAIGSYEDNKADLKQKIVKDMRHDKSKESVIARIKTEYRFTENAKALTAFYKVVTDSILNAKWKVDQAAKLRKKLFTLNGIEYNQQAFAAYLAKNQKKEKPEPIESYVNRKYKSFVEETLLAYEDTQLERKFEDFRLIVNEYRDGILLFDLTQRKVWDKAVKDTTGLEAFFATVRSNYMWDERKEAIIVTFKNVKSESDGNDLIYMANDMLFKEKLSFEQLKERITTDSTYTGSVELEKLVAGENELVDKLSTIGQTQKKVMADGAEKFTATLVYLNQLLPPAPKELAEVKGLVTAEYQNYLEKEWIKELRSKYPFTVHKDVFESIK